MAQIYETAIRVSGINNFSAMFATLIGGIASANLGIKQLEKGLASLHPAALGAVGGILGYEGLKVVKNIAEHGEKLLDQQNQMVRLGVSQNDVLAMTRNYYQDIAKTIPTADAAEYLKTVKELRAVTGDWTKAGALAPKALQMDALLENTMGEKSHGAGSEFYKLMRSAEMKGIATNDALRDHFTDLAYSYITAFQGKLTPNDLMTFARRGGTAFKNLDMDTDLGAFSVIAADVGGSKAGTALQTLQQLQLGAATMSKQQYAIFQQAGLIDPSKAHPTGFGGGKMQLDPGAIKGSLENVGHLAEWIETIIRPALMKLAGGDNNLYEALLGKAMPNRNAAGMAQMLGDPGFLDQRMKDIGLSKEALKSGAAYETFTKDDPTGVKKSFNAQYESMMQAIGAPMMQAAIPVMKGVTEFFTSVGAFANAHPDLMKSLGIGFAGLSAALLVVGGGAVLGAMATFAGTATLVAGGLTALGVSVGIAWLAFDHNWKTAADEFNASFKRVWFVEGWSALFTQIRAQLKTSADNSMAALKEFASWFGVAFPAALKADWAIITSVATSGFDVVKSAFSAFFDWLKAKVNWLGSFIPGWHDMSGRASDIPGMSEHLHGGDSGGGGYSGGTGRARGQRAILHGHATATGGHIGGGFSLAGGGTYADQIRKYGGSDAGPLLAIARSEGGIGNIYDKKGDHGHARGPFQFNHGLLGDQLIREGINIDNPASFPAQVAWMRKYKRQHGGWDANTWHGIRDKYHREKLSDAGADNQRSYAPPPRSNSAVIVHSRVNLDGRVLASGVERHIVKKHQFAHSTADHDGRQGMPHVDSVSNMG